MFIRNESIWLDSDAKTSIPTSIKYLSVTLLSILCLACIVFMVISSIVALRVYHGLSKLDPILSNVQETTAATKRTTERIDLFITVPYLNKMNDEIVANLRSADQVAQGYAGVSLALIDTLEKQVQPTFNLLRGEAQLTGAELRKQIKEIGPLIIEAREQIHDNGEATTVAINEITLTVASTREEVIVEIKKLQQVTDGLVLLTNDPSIAESFKATAANLNNIQVVTKNAAELAEYYVQPLVHPKKRSLLGKIGQGFITGYRVFSGSAQFVYLIGRF